MGGLIDGVGRIAVLRANALGDLVFALPALDALRAAYPAAEIVLLGGPLHAELLTGRPGPVDGVAILPPVEGLRPPGPGEASVPVGDFLANARTAPFDLAVQLHGGGRTSNRIVAALGARVTAGLRAPGSPPLDRWVPYAYYQSEVARYLEVVGLVGAAPVTVEPALAVTAADVAEARRVAGAPSRRRVVIHPGATDPRRRWSAGRFGLVARALISRGYEPVVTGTADEGDVVARVGAVDRRVRTLAGELSLGGLVGLLAGSAAIVANDTGPLHLATAVGTPSVGVYWAGNLVNSAPPFRGRHRPIPSWRVHCPVCGADCTRDIYPARDGGGCVHSDSFVDDVPVEEVLQAVYDLTDPRRAAAGPLAGRRSGIGY
ncbi:glycosyltransferase family 9 protein [Phytohabitans houttuyneae]|uniref:LPS biosynthesis-related glycosyltransferase n=1 Tax=Phytohabitans houttuyneae TaxID=1076126 RepID=A0A6V8KHH3_9ACTN|nr:glycosyltransferase family 9 protein [Phytohabitans houttuyneae]GFJ82830.1 LPS biosynthesis-related glycosyltransferase [Phytohabitans houttuyneae]